MVKETGCSRPTQAQNRTDFNTLADCKSLWEGLHLHTWFMVEICLQKWEKVPAFVWLVPHSAGGGRFWARASCLKRLGLVRATPWVDFAVMSVQLCSTMTVIFPCMVFSWEFCSILWIIVDYCQPPKETYDFNLCVVTLTLDSVISHPNRDCLQEIRVRSGFASIPSAGVETQKKRYQGQNEKSHGRRSNVGACYSNTGTRFPYCISLSAIWWALGNVLLLPGYKPNPKMDSNWQSKEWVSTVQICM